MPKHTRGGSSNHHRYSGLPVTLAPPPNSVDMYNARLSMSDYYSDVQAASGPIQLQTEQYEQYMTAGPAVQETVPAQQQPPPSARHRPSSGAWSKEDDETLMSARASGLNWGQIQQKYFSTKSPNACRKRHERLIEQKTADNWNKTDFEKLSMEYMRMRKEIWSPLAARVGEKWNVVEQKCMSNGLKNLQSAARSGARRQRLETGHQIQGYDDDSGISGIGLTPVDGLDASYSSPETTASAGHSSSGISTSSGYQMGAHSQLQALGHPGNPYGYSHPTGPHHGYTSSVSSNGTSAGPYVPSGSQSHSSDSSYMTHEQHLRAQRLERADMGVERPSNRKAGRGNRRGMQ